ncbi:MAG: Ldh family oxidoreductase [SAR324 cluster bacterium]|nr:Ldh family oxidoreductase [SAR324 cluster bacterium]
MPRFSAQSLRDVAQGIFQAKGFAEADAGTIAKLLVSSNLRGHDSHGFRVIPAYLKRIDEGAIVPSGQVSIEYETPTTAILSGHRTLGHVAASRAVEVVLEKARAMKVSAVGVRELEHVGRIGAYPEMIAEAGMVGLAYVNAQGWGRLVTAFGGVERRLGTNPIAVGLPNPLGAPILLDYATSTVAANKVRLADERGVDSGEGWIVDGEGRPTRAPQDFLNGLGMLLPFGAEHGYKGYALGVMVDILGGVLAGGGSAAAHREHLDNGTFLIAIDPEAFIAKEEYDAQVTGLVKYLRATRPLPGAPAVMIPGEYEEQHRLRREVEGIEIEAGVWEEVAAASTELGVELPESLD